MIGPEWNVEELQAAVDEHVRFSFRDFGRWEQKARAHGAAGSRYRVEARAEGQVVEAVLLCPAQPSRITESISDRYRRLFG